MKQLLIIFLRAEGTKPWLIAALRVRYTIFAITHRPAWTKIADRLYTISNGYVSPPKKSSKPESVKK
jgi:ABC-type siderophore export system fused ATPase/permease subunit